jgi:small conductance mechanosensitive channel
VEYLRGRLVSRGVAVSYEIAGFSLVQIAKVLVVLLVTYVVAKAVSGTLGRLLRKAPFPKQVETDIIRVSRLVIYLVGFFAVVSVLGINLTSIVLGLGVISIAISFAMSTIIQNLVSGILLIGDRTFVVGDQINIQTFEGKVVKIGVRTTVVERTDGDLVFVPNSVFMSNPVVKKTPKKSEPIGKAATSRLRD